MISVTSKPRSSPLQQWIHSSIGKKTLVAATGIALVLFVVGHLAGNMLVYLGADALNAYAQKLKDLGPALWVVRIGLLAVVGTHIYFTMLLWKENHAARPTKYLAADPIKTTIFARTMRLSGLIVLSFVVFHLSHFSMGLVDPAYNSMMTSLDGREVHDVYRMLVTGFSSAPIAVAYLVGLFLLTFHLSHGIASLFQTLGITDRKLRKKYEFCGRAIAWALFAGFASIPISVLVFGLGKEVLKGANP